MEIGLPFLCEWRQVISVPPLSLFIWGSWSQLTPRGPLGLAAAILYRTMCLLLGASGVGKTLLMKRLQKMTSKDAEDLSEVPPTQPTVGTNLTDLTFHRTRVTVREVGGSMGPIWSSYYNDCRSLLFVVDAANPFQVSASCIQLLMVLSSPLLATVSALILFNKMDLASSVSLVEMKSLFRMDDIISCAKQPISVLEISARDGTGLQDVLQWLQSSNNSRT